MYVIMSLWFFSGCGNDFDRTKPYIMNQKSTPLPTEKYDANRPDPHYASTIESAKIAAEKEKEIALIHKQRDIAIERLRQEASVYRSDTEKVIAFKKSETQISVAQQNFSMHKTYVFLLAAALFIGMIVLFYFLQKRRSDRLKMHEDMLHKEMYLKDRDVQEKMVARILDTLEKGVLSSEQQTKLVETLSHNTAQLPVSGRGSRASETLKPS